MTTKIRQSNLDVSVVNSQDSIAEIQNADTVLIYDTSLNALRKIKRGKLIGAPTVTSVSPTNVLTGDGTGNQVFTITGEDFDATATATLIKSNGSSQAFDSQSRDSSTQITGTIAKSTLSNSFEPYDVKVTNGGNNLDNTLENQINIDAQPVFVTSAGALASITDSNRTGVRRTVVATDPESAGNVTFELQSGVIPPGLSLSNEGSEGGTAVISGNATAVGTNTTYNFTLRAVDAASNTSSRSFSITVLAPSVTSFTSSGTFSVPAGLTAVNVLVVAGGGGGGAGHSGGAGAGGLIFRPGFPVTPGACISVTVGDGGAASNLHWPMTNRGCTGQDSVFGTLTAKGGGYGGGDNPGGPGGSGGGGSYTGIGSATQPTQPGDSGAYGFGNPGGDPTGSPGVQYCGGGGGAGAVGGQSPGAGTGGSGGAGKAYSISGTSVTYAGGGGGGFRNPGGSGGSGGPGGGGSGGPYGGNAGDGTANRGGGGGGGSGAGTNSGFQPGQGGAGGKGIVIVAF